MRILAIDPGYDRLGVAVLEKKTSETLLFSDCIETTKKSDFDDRLLIICKGIQDIIHNYKPQYLAMENLFFNTNQKTASRVAEVRGALIYIAKNNSMKTYEYTPLQVKMAVTGYGRSDKTQVTEMVKRLVKIEKKHILDDEFDAIAVGLTCLASLRHFPKS